MRIKLLLVMILGVFATGITCSIVLINNENIPEVDLAAINDTARTAEKNWGRISSGTFHNNDMKQPFSIIDDEGNMVYQTTGSHFDNIYEAMKSRDLFIDLERNGEIVGKLIIRNDEREMVEQLKSELIATISLILGLSMMIGILYIGYIYKVLLQPFEQLQRFAANVARGNLEMP